jgi:hypothetical protein
MEILFSRIGYRLPTSKSSFTKEELERIIRSTKFPMIQIDLRKDLPEVLVALIEGQTKDFFILVITEEGPALLVRDPESDELPTITQLPIVLRNKIMETTAISAVNQRAKTRKAGPVAAALPKNKTAKAPPPVAASPPVAPVKKSGIRIVSKLPA